MASGHMGTTKQKVLTSNCIGTNFAALNLPVELGVIFFEYPMKIYGYKEADTEIDGLLKLRDIGISASPDTLRAVANFINDAADELEKMGDDFGHLHLMDEWKGWSENVTDIQVINPKI